jgi:hypothetical protein
MDAAGHILQLPAPRFGGVQPPTAAMVPLPAAAMAAPTAIAMSANQPGLTAEHELFDSSRPLFELPYFKRPPGTIGKGDFTLRTKLNLSAGNYSMVKVCLYRYLLNVATVNSDTSRTLSRLFSCGHVGST